MTAGIENSGHAFFRSQADLLPQKAAPLTSVGILGWLRTNLFSSWLNAGLTFLGFYLLYTVIPPLFEWTFLTSDLVGESRFDCTSTGACWTWLDQRYQQYLYGFYPSEETWRLNIAFVLLFPAFAPLLFGSMPYARQLRWFSLAYPVIATILLVGGLGLEPVSTNKFGGFMLNLTVGLSGIVLSLPVGIVLALARRSKLPVIRILSVMFIEAVRGVPLITLLFVSNIILPIFMPPDVTIDSLIRVIIMVTAFSSAYMAEVIRGGLQAIPRGQYEAAQSMGLGYWKMMGLIVLPQAMKISIPGIVNTFIGLFKDTTLVILIGLFDVLGIGKTMVSNPDWQGLGTETYAFVAVFFFIVCFSMSRYSIHLEKRLDTEERR
jgi:general L-amino acid transport system permease protein